MTLRVSEVFFSLQGEASRVGLPTVFVRLTGCPLRCVYCDTEYAFSGGETRTLDAILAQVLTFPTRHVTVTGGEPMAQRACTDLLTLLCNAGLDVSLETSGALDISTVDTRVARIVDLKTPGSGEVARNLWSNIAHLSPRDEVKFVLTDAEDYAWAVEQIHQHHLAGRCALLFSAVNNQLNPAPLTPTQLADWILRDGLPVRLQVQLHKLLWTEARGR